MNFPEWAPSVLVDLYRGYSRPGAYPTRSNESPICDPSEHIAQLLKEDEKFKRMSKERQENYRTGLYRIQFGLTAEVGKELLARLITDLRMRPVWASLNRRVKHPVDLLDFWNACQRGILGWLGAQKLTPSEHKDFFMKIHEHASELSQMMHETAEFHHYSTAELISSDALHSLLNGLNTPIPGSEDGDDAENWARFVVSEGTPSIHRILDDIAAKSVEFSKEPPLVRKPNSGNAAVHHFVRTLSQYLQEEYRQPLYQVVAITAAVVFDRQEIDSDYVRKLVT